MASICIVRMYYVANPFTVLYILLLVPRHKRRLHRDSFSDISSVSSSSSGSDSEVSVEADVSSPPSPAAAVAAPPTNKTIESESDEESDDDSDIYEQLRNARRLSVNSVYSDKESCEEDEGEEENLSQEVEFSPPLATAVHTDHIYAKPPKTPEAQNDSDHNVDVEVDEVDEKLQREEMLTAEARKHMFPARSAMEEDKILNEFHHTYGPSKEDVEMFRLALKRLKEEKDELATDVPWAYYPSDILLLLLCMAMGNSQIKCYLISAKL